MSGFVSISAKVQFFDRITVQNAISADMLVKLKQWGAYGRKVVSRAPRRRKGRSKPGQVPTAWKGTENGVRSLRHALFAYAGDYKVVFGPTGLGNSQPATQTLEFGGKNAKVKNKLRRKRAIGHGAVIRVDGPPSKTTKSIKSPLTKKLMDVTFTKLRTDADVARAERLEEAIWGPMHFQQTIEERPFVGPSLVKTAEKFEAIFNSSGVNASVQGS